jgi:putative acetyltransferase
VKLTTGFEGRAPDLVALFTDAFTASEGVAEGRLIGGLVRDLLAQTPAEDIRVVCAEEDGALVGAAIFTRLSYPEDARRAVLLSPLAVAPARQRRGIGQTLLAHALAALRAEGVEIALTYGDPAYYARAGFAPITEAHARAPRPLSLPHGWLGQSLAGGPMPMLRGPARCVPALNRPELW